MIGPLTFRSPKFRKAKPKLNQKKNKLTKASHRQKYKKKTILPRQKGKNKTTMITYLFTDITPLYNKAYDLASELGLLPFFKNTWDDDYYGVLVPLSKALDNDKLSIGIENVLFLCISKAEKLGDKDFHTKNNFTAEEPPVVMAAATRTHIAEYILQEYEYEPEQRMNELIAQIAAEKYAIYGF